MRPYSNYQGSPGGFRIGPGSISPMIKYLIIANGIIFLLQGLSSIRLESIFGLVPAKIFSDFPNNLYCLYQTFTYMFFHAGFFHILFNMFVLWMFGTEIEYKWGSRPFLKYYFLCGLGGAFLSLIFNYNLAHPIIGASGAIYGILAAYWLMFPDRTILIFFLLPMRVRWAIPLLAILNFVASGPYVAHLAHLGGALVGFAYMKLDWHRYSPSMFFKKRRMRNQEQKLEKKRLKAGEIMKRVDRILDKINEVGFENISREDKKFLESASEILSENDKH